MRAAKSKMRGPGRPMVPLSNISDRKGDGLTGSPSPAPAGMGNAQLATGGTAKKRADKKSRGGKTDKWIQGAIKHPGAEKKAAAKAGESTHEYMEKHENSPGKAGARARLGLRLSAMAKKK